MDKRRKITIAVVSGAILFSVGIVAFAILAYGSFFFRGPKDPVKAERELAQLFARNPEVFDQLALIAREDRNHFAESITIQRRGTVESDLSPERIEEYRSLISGLGAERLEVGSSDTTLAIKIDLHSWGYADSYQVVGWYFGDPFEKDQFIPEPHRVDSISIPYRHPKDRPTTSLQPSKQGWWYFLEHGD